MDFDEQNRAKSFVPHAPYTLPRDYSCSLFSQKAEMCAIIHDFAGFSPPT